MKRQFQKALIAALRGRSPESMATNFYNSWFKDDGTPYFFLFKKNLRITNLQFAELIALIRCHLHMGKRRENPNFISAEEFKQFVGQLFSDFYDFDGIPLEKQKHVSQTITKLYSNIIGRFVILNPYFGSCSVYLPPGAILPSGDYSPHCCIDVHDIVGSDLQKFAQQMAIKSALQIKANSYDIIITDPPYGFNTDEEDKELAKLYKDFIWKAVAALKDEGQLVLCCPQQSYSGKHIPIYAQPAFVTQLVLLAAEDCGKAIETRNFSLPTDLNKIRAPYYWEAPTALRRNILHFQVSETRDY